PAQQTKQPPGAGLGDYTRKRRATRAAFSFFLYLVRYARVSVIERTPVQPYQRSQLRQATQPGEPARPADHRQASSLEGTQTTCPTSLAGFFFSLPVPSLPPKRRCS
ncbi:unnamed protein product, partial [Ixodes persulcatus]